MSTDELKRILRGIPLHVAGQAPSLAADRLDAAERLQRKLHADSQNERLTKHWRAIVGFVAERLRLVLAPQEAPGYIAAAPDSERRTPSEGD